MKNNNIKTKKPYHVSRKKPLVRLFLVICLSLFVFGLFITFNPTAKAAEGSQAPLLETYREQKFKGARDEENLKVVTDLQTSEANKKKKSKEADEGF